MPESHIIFKKQSISTSWVRHVPIYQLTRSYSQIQPPTHQVPIFQKRNLRFRVLENREGFKHTPPHTTSRLSRGTHPLPILWPHPVGGQPSFLLTFPDPVLSLPNQTTFSLKVRLYSQQHSTTLCTFSGQMNNVYTMYNQHLSKREPERIAEHHPPWGQVSLKSRPCLSHRELTELPS